MGDLIFINFNRGRIGQFGIGTIWIYLPDQAANAAIRRFLWERRERRLWVVAQSRLLMNPVLLLPVLLPYLVDKGC